MDLTIEQLKRKRFWDLKRWWVVAVCFLFLLFLVLSSCSLSNPLPTKPLPNDRDAKASRNACKVNLKLIGLGLMLYANDNDGYYPQDLTSLPANGYINSNNILCPATAQTYRYVPYRKKAEETAVNQPIVIDALESHWTEPDGSRILLTPVLFTDGRVVNVIYLSDYMGIYDEFGKFLSPEDAAVLKGCCEAWDKGRQRTDGSGTPVCSLAPLPPSRFLLRQDYDGGQVAAKNKRPPEQLPFTFYSLLLIVHYPSLPLLI